MASPFEDFKQRQASSPFEDFKSRVAPSAPAPEADEGILSNLWKGAKTGVAGTYGGIAGWVGGENAATKYFDDVVQSNRRSREHNGYDADYFLNGSGLAYDLGQLVGSVASLAPTALLPGVGAVGGAAARFVPRLLGSGFARSAASKVGAGAARAAAEKWATDEAGKAFIKNAVRYGAGSGGVESLSEGGSGVTEGFKNGDENPYLTGLEITAKNLPLLIASNTLEAATLGRGALRFGGKAGESVAKRAALAVPRATPYAAAQAVQQSGEELLQQRIQEEAFNRPTGGILPSTWTPEEMQAVQDTLAAGGVMGLVSGLPGGFRRPNSNPMRNQDLDKAQQIINDAQQAQSSQTQAPIDSEPTAQPAMSVQEAQSRISAPTISAENSLDGFDNRYVSKWESQPGATDLASVQQSVKNNFNAAIAEYGDNVILTGGAEKGYHAEGAEGHEGGWKIDVDKTSVKDPQKFLQAMAKYGFKVGDEGDHYDLSGHAKGGVGGTVVATPDSFISDGGQATSGFNLAGRPGASIAQKISERTGIPADWIWAQMYHETGNFDSELATKHHNYGGIKARPGDKEVEGGSPEGGNYRHFDSDDEYADYAAKNLLAYAEDGILEAKTIEEFAQALKNGGYFTDSLENYVNGLKNALGSAGSTRTGNSSTSTDVEIPNTKVDTSDDHVFDEYNKQLDELAEKGIEAPFKTEQPTQKELVQQAKNAAIEAGDMDEVQRINSAERSGNKEELAKIADKALKAKQKEVKGKSAPATPEIKMASPNLIAQVKQLLNTAKEQGVKLDTNRLENTLEDGSEETLQNFAGMLQSMINAQGYENRLAQGKQLLEYADNNRIDLAPNLRAGLVKGYPKAIEAGQTVIDQANAQRQSQQQEQVQLQPAQTPVQAQSTQNQKKSVADDLVTYAGIYDRAYQNKEIDGVRLEQELQKIETDANKHITGDNKDADVQKVLDATQAVRNKHMQQWEQDAVKRGAEQRTKAEAEEEVQYDNTRKGMWKAISEAGTTKVGRGTRWNKKKKRFESYELYSDKTYDNEMDAWDFAKELNKQEATKTKQTTDVDNAGDKSAETKKATDEGGIVEATSSMTMKENIANGEKAIHYVAENHEDVNDAMYREDTGKIDFVWGTPGKGKNFKKGYGVAHILAKHVPESGEDLLNTIVETIARGEIISKQSSKGSTQSRVLIGHNGHTALLSMSDGSKNTWLLTGWENFEDNKKTSNANGEGNGSTAATSTTPMRSRRDGEDVSSSTPSIPQEQEKVTQKDSDNNKKVYSKVNHKDIEIEQNGNQYVVKIQFDNYPTSTMLSLRKIAKSKNIPEITGEGPYLRFVFDDKPAADDFVEKITNEKKQKQPAEASMANSYNGFTDNMTAMQKARTAKTLAVEVDDVDGKGKVTRAEYVEKAVADDRPIHKVETDKGVEYRIYTGDADSSYVKVTKTEYDYAQYLGAKPLTDKVEAKPEKKKPAKAKQSESAEKSNDKLEDFGEYLYGARKDYYGAYSQKLETAEKTSFDDAPLSKCWPEPDYAKLLGNNVDPKVVSFVRALRDVVSAEMPNKRSWKYRSWKAVAKDLRQYAFDALKNNKPVKFEDENNPILQKVLLKAKLYEEVGHDVSLKKINILKEIGVTYYRGMREYKGTAENPLYVVEGLYGKNAITPSNSYKDVLNKLKEYIKGLQENKGEAQNTDDKFKKKIKVGRERGENNYMLYVNFSTSSKWAPLKAGFETPEEARAYRDTHIDELKGIYEELKKEPAVRRPANSPRVGTDYRNGKDITPDEFSDTFGFRGVQFGNWVEKDRRQLDINEAYDALLDLAGVLNISPRALSLGGELGLAFGSRGVPNASAHYEPGTVVINLSKKKGAGSLAHEWFHSVDHYLSRKTETNQEKFMTEGMNKNGRKPLVAAFQKLRKAFYETGLEARSEAMDYTRSKPYYSQSVEMGARAFETYVIEKLKQQGMSNDFLANIQSEETFKEQDKHTLDMFPKLNTRVEKIGGTRYPYPLASEMKTFEEVFDNIFDTIEEKVEDGKHILYSVSDESVEQMSFDDFANAVKEEFPYAKDFQQDGNVVRFVLPGGQQMQIDMVDKIAFTKEEKASAEKSYGRELNDSETPKGTFKGVGIDGFITLASNAPSGTISHEAYHMVRQFLPVKVQSFLSGRYKNEEAEAEAYRKWRAARNRSGMFTKIWQQVKDIASSIADLLSIQTEHSIFRQIESGEAYKNTPQTATQNLSTANFDVNNNTVRLHNDSLPNAVQNQLKTIAANHDGTIGKDNIISFKTEQGRDDFVREVEALLSVTNPESSADIRLSVAWTGSPADFDTFSLDYIGTGEGAQAHGYGLYSAANRVVAQGYRDKLSEFTNPKVSINGTEYERTEDIDGDIIYTKNGEPLPWDTDDIDAQVVDYFIFNNFNKKHTKEAIEKQIQEFEKGGKQYEGSIENARKIIERLNSADIKKISGGASGKLYQVEIPDSDVLLDEQKSFNEQPEKVQNALRKLISESETAKKHPAFAEEIYEANGKKIYGIVTGLAEGDAPRNANFNNTQRLGSELLNKYGIKGITYEGGRDDRCFVIFDDQAIEIINKFSAEGEIRRAVEQAVPVANEDLTPQQRKMSEFGKQMGTPILWISTDPKLHGFHAPNGTTVLNVRSNMDLSKTFWHETFHWIANNNESLYNELMDYFKGKKAFSEKQLDAYRKKIGRPGISDELAIEEMLADNFEEVTQRVKIFKEMGAEQPSLARQFVAWVKRIMDKFAEFFHNPEGKLTTAQRDSFVKAFGRLARDMVDGNGRPLFKVYKEGREIRLTNGRLVTEGIKLSAEKGIDSETKVGDNEDKEEAEREAFIKARVPNENIKKADEYVDKLLDNVRDELGVGNLEAIFEESSLAKGIRTTFENEGYLASLGEDVQALKDMASMIYFHARRRFANDTRVKELLHRRDAISRQQRELYLKRNGRLSTGGQSRAGEIGRQNLGAVFGESKESSDILNHFENLYSSNTSRSEKGGFSSGKTKASYGGETKYSYGPSNNSNEGFLGWVRNYFSQFSRENVNKHEEWRIRKRLTDMLSDALQVQFKQGEDVSGGVYPLDGFGVGQVVFKEDNKVVRSKNAYDFDNILPIAGAIIAERLGMVDKWTKATAEQRNYIAKWIARGAPNDTSPEAKAFAKAMRGNQIMATRLESLQDEFLKWNDMDSNEQMQHLVSFDNKKKVTWKQRKEQFYEQVVEELAPVDRLVKAIEDKRKAEGKGKLNELSNPMTQFRLLRGSYGNTIAMIEEHTEPAVEALRKKFPNLKPETWDRFRTIRDILEDIGGYQNRDVQVDFVTYCLSKHVLDMHKHNEELEDRKAELMQKKQTLQDEIEEFTERKKKLMGSHWLSQKEIAEVKLLEKNIEGNAKRTEEIEKKLEGMKLMPIPKEYSQDNCEKYIRDYDKKYGEKFSKAQQDLVHFSNTTAEILYDSGVIGKKRYDELMGNWPNYVPTFRVFDENEDIDFGDSMKHIEGSFRDFVNPLESIIRNTADFIQRSETNRCRALLATIARCDSYAHLIEEKDAKDNEEKTITFYENGEKKYLVTDPDIVRAVNNFMKPNNSGVVMKFLHAITAFARAAFTTANPEFFIRNIVRDWQDASIYSKYGYHVGLTDLWKGFMHFWNRDDVYLEWLTQGGAQASALALDRDYTQSTLNRLGRTKMQQLKTLNPIEFVKGITDIIQRAGEYTEYATRIATYEKTKRAVMEKNAKASMQEAMAEAAFESRDLMDFARHGKGGAEWNKLVAFSNASIQGFDKLYRNLTNPETRGKTMAKLALYGIMPAIVLFMMNKDDEEYKQAETWLKETHWLIPMGEGQFLRIPKAADVGIRFLSNLVEKSFEYAYYKKPHEWTEYMKPFWDAAPGLAPTALLPMGEILANYDSFTGRAIVPQKEQKLPAKLQYGEHQTKGAKWLGELLYNISPEVTKKYTSPRMIEHFIVGYGGTMGMLPLKALDLVMGEKSQSLSITELPVVRGFLWKTYKNPESINDFYKAYNKQTELKNEYKLTHKKPEDFNPAQLKRLEKAQKMMQKIKKQEKAIIDSDKWSIHDKEVMQRNIQKKRIEIAKRALGTK